MQILRIDQHLITLNAYELAAVEDTYHDDLSTLHLLFATDYGVDAPPFTPHDGFVKAGVDGLTGHTGSPVQVTALEQTGKVPYGVVMLNDQTPTFTTTKAVFIHEMGHAIGAGYADDTLAALGECYSGEDCVATGLNGSQQDETVEEMTRAPGDDWSIMARSGERIAGDRLAFSIEELSTVISMTFPRKTNAHSRMTERYRRHVLALCAAVGSSLAGCHTTGLRTLSFASISVTYEREQWVLNTQVKNDGRGLEPTEETFEEVDLLTYDRSGSSVGRSHLGTVSGGYNEQVRTPCTGFPTIITFDARDSICKDNTDISVACFRGRTDGRLFWDASMTRNCDEGLPPRCEDLATPPSENENSPTTANSTRTGE
jgi:hypothetical protein